MSNKLVLVVAGDQFAVDLLTEGDPGGVLSGQTQRDVQVIRVGDDAEMAQKIVSYNYAKRIGTSNEGGEVEISWYGTQKTADYYVDRLTAYAAKVAAELPASGWDAAGVWWFLGLTDATLIRAAGEDNSSLLSALQSDLGTLLAWNPFGAGHSAKNHIAIVPAYPEYGGVRSGFMTPYGTQAIRSTPLTNLNTAIAGAVTSAGSAAASIAVPASITGWDESGKPGGEDKGLRKVEESKDYGLSEGGARAYADAFAAATKSALNITADPGEGNTKEETKVVYTPRTSTYTRNKLSGLEGKTATVLVDGVPYTVTVSSNGTLTLPQGVSGNKLTVGFNYPSVLAPMPLESDSQTHGSTLGKKRAYGKCEVRVYRSKGGKYGASSTNDLYDVESWRQDASHVAPNRMFLYDIPYQLFRDDKWPFSGDVEFSLPSGQDPDTTIWIVQDEPWPLRIVSIMADVDFGQM